MFELKPLSREAVPQALEKAMRYRLLNEPRTAESICRDILDADPENQEALITLLLAVTDQFYERLTGCVPKARELLPRFKKEYEKHYYTGIVNERQGKAILGRTGPGSQHAAYDWLRKAMVHFEKAEQVHPEGNEDAVLRWNACARIIMENKLAARPEDETITMLE
jgi:hypothetical protein